MSASFDIDFGAELARRKRPEDEGVDVDLSAAPVDVDLSGTTETNPRFSPDQLAAEQLRQQTGQRKQFDAEVESTPESPDAPFQNPDMSALKDFVAPFHDPDARRQIKDMGTAGAVASAMESIPVAITQLGQTPVDENPNASVAARLSQGLGGGIARAALTGPLGPAAVGFGEAAAKAGQIATTDPEAFRERPVGTTARIGVAGAIPSASAKLAGVVAPKLAGALQSPSAQFGAGAATAGGVDFALNTGQKGVEYLGSSEDPTIAGLAGAMKPTALDLATLAPGAVGGGFAARKALAGALEAPDTRPMPEVEIEAPPQSPEVTPTPQAEQPTGLERPVIQESGAAPVLSADGGGAPGDADPRYAGGFNKRLFGMEDNPELQNVYEQQAARTGNPLEPVSRTETRAAADQTPSFTLEKLRKIQKADDARSLTPAETQAMSDQMSGYANARLSRDLSADEQGMFDELSRATRIARGVRGQDLALLNQQSIARDVEQGNYKAAAVKALDEISPTGQASPEAIKAIREMADNPLEMARTVFRESRRNHGFLQNFVVPNLLSNVLGTQSVNSFSNVLKLAADTAAASPAEYGTRLAGAAKGASRGKERASFAFREGFPERALEDPTLAAKAPGFAFGGRKNPFNIPGRAAFASDEFFKGMAERSHLDVLVKARAKELAGGDVAKQAEIETELTARPPKDLLDESRDFASKATYQAEPKEGAGWLGDVEASLSRMINAGVLKGTRAEIKPIKLLGVPFWTTVLNVAKANVRYSPLSIPGTVYKGATGKITPGQAVAQTAMGLLPTMAGIALAEAGYITGPMPDDPAEREAFFQANKKPWSIQIGSTNIPLVWAGPFAMSLGIGAAIKDAKRKQSLGKIDDEAMSLVGQSAYNTYKLFSESSPLIALNSLMNVFADPTENKLKKWASDFGSQFVPLVSAQGFVNRQNLPLAGAARDPYMRDTSAESALEEVYNRIVSRTVYSHTLPKRETSLGTNAMRAGAMTGTADPVFAELYRLGVYPGMPSESLPKESGALRAEKMTPEEYRSVLQAGDPVYNMLRQQLATPTWAELPDDQKRLIVDRTLGAKGLGRFREVARKKVQANRLAGAAN